MTQYKSSNIIRIGSLLLGGNFPIRIQTMTNTDTNDVLSTTRQCIQLVEAGCEMVRITTQGLKEVKSFTLVKENLKRQGFIFPLIADVHFNAKVAEAAAEVADKVRINPGNYTGKWKQGAHHSHLKFEQELEIIHSNLRPLLAICKRNGTAIRIGVNHGSLSGRIVDRYGDTPEGMVESAMEFARICAAEGFDNLVFSMKSSNVLVMTESTRLLKLQLQNENMLFPIHLGVTEAGTGEAAIVKSALGIGSLLEEGIGDTLRVSLTGNPVTEIPVARAIAARYNDKNIRKKLTLAIPVAASRRNTTAVSGVGGDFPVGVIATKAEVDCMVDENFSAIGSMPESLQKKFEILEGPAALMLLKASKTKPDETKPVILKNQYYTDNLLDFQVQSAIDFGSVLLKGIGNAIWPIAGKINDENVNSTAFAILQAARLRFSRTEFISCPSCGRTLFDIETKLEEVKRQTAHLKNLKIAVMGCIVNGPGEMADADFGYVGAGRGKVSIYKGKTEVYRNIPEGKAIEMLIQLIKSSGFWREADNEAK